MFYVTCGDASPLGSQFAWVCLSGGIPVFIIRLWLLRRRIIFQNKFDFTDAILKDSLFALTRE
jgi:hypothetical protein